MNFQKQANFGREIKSFIIISIIINVIFIISAKYSLRIVLILALIDFLFLMLCCFIKRPFSIEISQDQLLITHKSFIKFNKITKIDLEYLKYSFDREAISQTGREKVLRIYETKKMILKISSNYGGWSEGDLQEIVNEFVDLGIELIR